MLNIGVNFNSADLSLNVLGSSAYSTPSVRSLRVLRKSIYEITYIEAYIDSGEAANPLTLDVRRLSGTGWVLIDAVTGEVPAGYTEHTINTSNAFAVNDDSKTFTVTKGGNVGIGTTAPASNLQLGTLAVTSTATPTSLSLGGTFSSTAGANPKLKVWDDGSSPYGLGVSNGQLDFIVPTGARYAWSIAGNEKLRIDTNGNVGIGLTSPSTKLDASVVA